MRAVIQLKLDAALRVLVFFSTYPDPNPAAILSVTRLERLAARFAALVAAQQQDQAMAKESLDERVRVERDLRVRLAHLVRLARAVARQEGIPELRLEGRIGSSGPSPLLKAVSDAVARVRPHHPVLLRYGMSPELLMELERGVEGWRQAEERRKQSQAACFTAAPLLEAAAAEAHDVIRHLDALNRIRFATDPACFAQWEAARSIRWDTRQPSAHVANGAERQSAGSANSA